MSSSPFQIDDPRFLHLIASSARLDELFTGCRWAEGPVWFADTLCLLWSDIPNQRILRWSMDATGGGSVSVFRQPSNFANGQTRDRQGRLVTCEHGGRRVTRTEVDGSITVLAESYQGKRLNSPNDVIVASDGAIWFSDPTYGILSDYEGYQSEPEQPAKGIYRLAPDGQLAQVASDFLQPNGLAFSLDERTLYVADSGASHAPDAPRHIFAFDVRDGRLSGQRVFATIDVGIPDGMRVDVQGNLWSSAGDGVHCIAPDGTRLGKILVPQSVANLTFGGPKRNRLFIAASASLYAIYLAVSGVQTP